MLGYMCHFLSLLHFRPIFDKIRRESDQRRAADGMLKKPMSVISGRAGTGKTEVAVTVWKAIKEKWDKYVLRNPTNYCILFLSNISSKTPKHKYFVLGIPTDHPPPKRERRRMKPTGQSSFLDPPTRLVPISPRRPGSEPTQFTAYVFFKCYELMIN